PEGHRQADRHRRASRQPGSARSATANTEAAPHPRASSRARTRASSPTDTEADQPVTATRGEHHSRSAAPDTPTAAYTARAASRPHRPGAGGIAERIGRDLGDPGTGASRTPGS